MSTAVVPLPLFTLDLLTLDGVSYGPGELRSRSLPLGQVVLCAPMQGLQRDLIIGPFVEHDDRCFREAFADRGNAFQARSVRHFQAQ